MRYEGQHFSKQRVRLDGNEFDSCRFTDVVFDYAGGPIHLCGCKFEGLGWAFDGDLARGLAVIGQLYANNQPAALGQLAQVMFPKLAADEGRPSRPHPSLAAVLEADERDAAAPQARGDKSNVEDLDYSRLKVAIKRDRRLAKAA